MLRKTGALAITALVLAACATTTTPEERRAKAEERCAAAGIDPTTDGYKRCVEDQVFKMTPRNRTMIDPNGEVIILE